MEFIVRGTSRVIGIIGCPVRHSLSPVMQNAALAARGLDCVYVPFEVAPADLAAAVAGMRALNIAGFNVTVPHKTRVMPYLDRLDESAVAAGAVNTVRNDSGCLTGFNTDGDGLLKALGEEFGFVPPGSSVAILGAGGAARGAVAAMCRAGVNSIVVANRTVERAVELVELMWQQFPDTALTPAPSFEALEGSLPSCDLLVNTTSQGMQPDSPAIIRLEGLSRAAIVYDMIYAPPVTPLLRDAARLGLRHANGLGMLAAQGELGFEIWTGEEPPDGLMKSVLTRLCSR